MKKTYLCPHCRAVLNPNVKIVFVIANEGKRGLLLLNAKPGDYGLIADPTFPLEERDLVDFLCPVCDADLKSTSDGDAEDFAEIIQAQESGREVRVEFSRVFGTHATFIVDGREVSSFGEDAESYGDVNFFGH